MLFHRSGQIAGLLALRIERAIIRVLREMVDRFLKLNADGVMEPVHAVAGVIDHQPRHARVILKAAVHHRVHKHGLNVVRHAALSLLFGTAAVNQRAGQRSCAARIGHLVHDERFNSLLLKGDGSRQAGAARADDQRLNMALGRFTRCLILFLNRFQRFDIRARLRKRILSRFENRIGRIGRAADRIHSQCLSLDDLRRNPLDRRIAQSSGLRVLSHLYTQNLGVADLNFNSHRAIVAVCLRGIHAGRVALCPCRRPQKDKQKGHQHR